MKTLIATLLGTFMCLGSISHAAENSTLAQIPAPVQVTARSQESLPQESLPQESLPQDTITISIGDDKKVIILVKDKEALRSLQQYDLNKMVRDLAITADSAENSKSIVITDEDGNRYRIAYSIEIETSDEDEFEEALEEELEEEEEEKDDDKNEYNFSFNGNDDDNEFKRTRSTLLFDVGINNYLHDGEFPQEGDQQYAVKSWGSWYVGINKAFTTQLAGPLALQWGGGVSWYNFKFEDPSTRLNKADGQAVFTQELTSEIHSEKSKLTASFINIMAVPMLDFGYGKKTITREDGSTEVERWHKDEAFRIGLGGYAGYRLGSYTKYKYELNNDEKKDRDRGSYYLNNWRYGVRMQVGYKGIDLFAQYDLNELFTENRGPELNAFSFGITF